MGVMHLTLCARAFVIFTINIVNFVLGGGGGDLIFFLNIYPISIFH